MPQTPVIINKPTNPQMMCFLPMARFSSLPAFQMNSEMPQKKNAMATLNISPIKGLKIPVMILFIKFVNSKIG